MLTTKANSAWAVKTSAGIILIDTLFGYAAQDEIVDGMKKLGLDPADIKYIVVSHAHGDHDGAVKFLQDTYHPHVILAPKDWELAARQATPYTHDMDATDGQKLTLGDTTITIYITPGHTGGTLSFLVPVKDHGVPHLAMEWGGTALSAQHVEGNAAVLHFERRPLPGYRGRRRGRRDYRQPHRIQRCAGEAASGPKRGNPANPTLGWSARRKSGIISPSSKNAPSPGWQSTKAAPDDPPELLQADIASACNKDVTIPTQSAERKQSNA